MLRYYIHCSQILFETQYIVRTAVIIIYHMADRSKSTSELAQNKSTHKESAFLPSKASHASHGHDDGHGHGHGHHV